MLDHQLVERVFLPVVYAKQSRCSEWEGWKVHDMHNWGMNPS